MTDYRRLRVFAVRFAGFDDDATGWRRGKQSITEERFHQVEDYFDRHGGKTIVIGRFRSLRSPTSNTLAYFFCKSIPGTDGGGRFST